MEVSIYTDGSCLGNPGPGGWAAIIINNSKKEEIYGGEKSITKLKKTVPKSNLICQKLLKKI